MTVKKSKKDAELNNFEHDELDDFHGDKAFHFLCLELKKAGLDPVTILKKELKQPGKRSK
jgi:3-methyladenine DNA glycosylase Tag